MSETDLLAEVHRLVQERDGYAGVIREARSALMHAGCDIDDGGDVPAAIRGIARERDEAKVELERSERALKAQAKVATNWKRELNELSDLYDRETSRLTDERDEARSEAESERGAVETQAEHIQDLMRREDALKAEVERLRAAQQLPERLAQLIDDARTNALRCITTDALSALLDAEAAADTTTPDDEDHEYRGLIADHLARAQGSDVADPGDSEVWRRTDELIAALNAHCARAGQGGVTHDHTPGVLCRGCAGADWVSPGRAGQGGDA
jgi:chromosome segregation ATPase